MKELRKRLYFSYIILDIIICIFWGIGYKKGLIEADSPFINFVTMFMLFGIINGVYVSLISQNKRDLHAQIFFYFPVILFLGLLILKETYIFVGILMIVFFLIWSIISIKERKLKDNLEMLVLFFLWILVYKFSLRYILLILILLGIYLFTRKNYSYKYIKKLNVLPIPKEYNNIFVIFFLVFLGLITFFFDLETIEINILINGFLVFFLIFFYINLESMAGINREMESFYLLLNYIEEERDEFSRILHDEVIQDIKASKNFLVLKEPDLEYSVNILTNLEDKLRKTMNFYSAHVFDYFSLYENMENMIMSIKNLYPEKKIDINLDIDSELSERLEQSAYKIVIQISKELINNIYKHSDATFISCNYELKDEKILIRLISDGTDEEDYNKIEDSIGGILMLKLLINKKQGEIKYFLDGELLTTEINLDLEILNENTFI